ncbi:MAG: hypothetical protein ACOY40_00665 [Bacillota bacterium]
MESMLVGVKFCGNCNPSIDSPVLLSQLEAKFAGVKFVGWSEPGIRALLMLNGCPTACATVPEFTGPVITVAGNTIERFEVDPEALAEVVAAKILELKIFSLTEEGNAVQ